MPTPAPIAALDDLLAKAEDFAEFSMRSRGKVPPVLMAACPNGLIFFTPQSLANEDAKDDFANMARLVCVANAATAVVLILESWMKCAKRDGTIDLSTPPSESLDRQEIVLLAGETYLGPKHKILPIIRTSAGGFFGFGESDGPTLMRFAGRFAQILPPKEPSPRMQREAQMLLAAFGITFASLRRDPSAN